VGKPLDDGMLPGLDQAVTHRDGGLVVLGGAGTGKTRLIERRFRWLVDQGLAPDRLAVVVPSAARADAIRGRLEAALERGYEQLFVLTPVELGALVLDQADGADALSSILGPGERLAMLLERIDELSVQHHDFGGSPRALLGGFVRRIDRCKSELISAEDYAAWAVTLAEAEGGDAEREFAEVYRTHERMLADSGACDDGDVIRDALRVLDGSAFARRIEHLLVDDAQELGLAAATLVSSVGGAALTVAGDPDQGLACFRGAGCGVLSAWRRGRSPRSVVRFT
jgi:DNA helicase II / ATP-dependent DNA helicase PcrA